MSALAAVARLHKRKPFNGGNRPQGTVKPLPAPGPVASIVDEQKVACFPNSAKPLSARISVVLARGAD
jgi:hypothetical protein